jgi:hypothetical protein
MNSITKDFENHANRIASGFAAMSPEPDRQTFNPNHNMTETTAPVTEPTESTDSIVIRESGLVGRFELRWQSQADIEALTGDLLSKKERSELINLSAACDRLGAEVHRASDIPVNAGKIASAWHAEHPGEIVPMDLIEAGANGEQLRSFAKSTAKIAANVFFDQNCTPAIRAVFYKAAALLANVISDRVKREQSAFEQFAAVFHDGDEVAYSPSAGLLRLMARRRQLLDFDFMRTSPPSISGTLQGIYAV